MDARPEMSVFERVVVAETRLEELLNDQKDLKTSQREILLALASISAELTRYKGFLGGVAFLLSAMWAAILLFKDSILAPLSK